MTTNEALTAVTGVVMDSKITDWKPVISEDKVRMEAAEKLRDAAEMVLGYCHIDPTRSAIRRNRIPRIAVREKCRAAMTPEERAQHDVMRGIAGVKVDVMEREGLTFTQMEEVMETVPV